VNANWQEEREQRHGFENAEAEVGDHRQREERLCRGEEDFLALAIIERHGECGSAREREGRR
jgi:hypothetical protein